MVESLSEGGRQVKGGRRGVWLCGAELLIAISMQECWRIYWYDRHQPGWIDMHAESLRRVFGRRWMHYSMRLIHHERLVSGRTV